MARRGMARRGEAIMNLPTAKWYKVPL